MNDLRKWYFLRERTVLISTGYCLAISLIFYQTAASMVAIWLRSDTFAHGFLIVPIVIWLIWAKRKELSLIQPSPEYRAVLLLGGAGGLWLLGYVVNALVVQQLAFVALIVSGLWVILGNSLIFALAFPLAFLFLAVPVGEGLVPVLMEFTATFTVGLLKLTGIPVFREGLYFSLPSGNWSVIEACSGVRYLIASFTLGCLFAYLNYRSLVKRLVFIVVAIIVPVFANGLRAYIIVMLGHLSDMKLATGVDHLIYGWAFFGLVMLILFSIGSIWRDNDTEQAAAAVGNHRNNNVPVAWSKIYIAVGLSLLMVVVWPLSAYLIENRSVPQALNPLEAPMASDGWVVMDNQTWKWKPVVSGPDSEIIQFYQRDGQTMSLYVGQFLGQDQGKELINSQNILVVEKSEDWRVVSQGKVAISLQGNSIEVDRAVIKGSGFHLLVLRWYRLGDTYTSNPYIAKLISGLARLTFARQDAAYITVAVAVDAETGQISGTLQSIIDAILPGLENSLDRVVGKNSA